MDEQRTFKHSNNHAGPLAAKIQYMRYFAHMLKHSELRQFTEVGRPKSAQETALWDVLADELNSFGPNYAMRTRDEWIYTFRTWRNHCRSRKQRLALQQNDGDGKDAPIRPLSSLEERAMTLWNEAAACRAVNDISDQAASLIVITDDATLSKQNSPHNRSDSDEIVSINTTTRPASNNLNRNDSKRKRQPKASPEQYQIYVQHMRKHKELRFLHGPVRFSAQQMKAAWTKLTRELNAVKGAKATKTCREWKRTFTQWKSQIRHRVRMHEAGEPTQFQITALHEAALALWAEKDEQPDDAKRPVKEETAVEEYDANSYSIDEQYEDSEGELALQYERLLDDDDDKNQTTALDWGANCHPIGESDDSDVEVNTIESTATNTFLMRKLHHTSASQYDIYIDHLRRHKELGYLSGPVAQAKSTEKLWQTVAKELNSDRSSAATMSCSEWRIAFGRWQVSSRHRYRCLQRNDAASKNVQPLSQQEERAIELWGDTDLGIQKEETSATQKIDPNHSDIAYDECVRDDSNVQEEDAAQCEHDDEDIELSNVDALDVIADEEMEVAENGSAEEEKNTTVTTKKREPKTTREQFQIYVEHMRRHEKLRTFTDASDEATKLWRNLTTVLNSIDGAPTRTVEHWMMTFKKWKIACRFQLRWLEHPSTAGSLLDTSKRNSMSDLPDVMQQALRLWQEMDNIPDAASVEKTKITSTEFVDVERGGADANRLPEIDTETDVDNSNVPISQQSPDIQTIKATAADQQQVLVWRSAAYEKKTIELLHENNRLRRATMKIHMRGERRAIQRHKMHEETLKLLRRRDERDADEWAQRKRQEQRDQQRHELWMSLHSQRVDSVRTAAPPIRTVTLTRRLAQPTGSSVKTEDPLDLC